MKLTAADLKKVVKVDVVRRENGMIAIYLNDRRLTGRETKWGVGKTIASFTGSFEDIAHILEET